MSTSHNAAVVVGLYHDDFIEADKEDLLEQLIDGSKMEIFPPYFNADDNNIIGLLYAESGDYSSSLFSYNEDEVNKLKIKFQNLTGLEPKVYLTVQSW